MDCRSASTGKGRESGAGLVLAAVILLAAGCGGASGNVDRVRHVLLISIDTLRADHLACYGHGYVETPRIDQLAAEGVLFENHFSTAPTTLASHTSLMTGTFPHTHGVARNGYVVADSNVMLAETLGQAGFVTAGFVGAAPLDRQVNFNQGFDHYDARYTTVAYGSPSGYQRRASEVSDAVLTWLDGREAGEDDRLFLFVHYFDVHYPYEAPEPYRGMYLERALDLPADVEPRKYLEIALKPTPTHEHQEQHFLERVRTDAAQFFPLAEALEAEYCGEITYTDHHIGRLLDGLVERGLLDEMLIIVTSDHGETLYEHSNVFSHGESVYDSEIHTPLIVRLPDGRHGGARSDHLVSSVDVFPTILDLLGLPSGETIEGVSFRAALDGAPEQRSPIFAEATKPWQDARFQDEVWTNRGKFQCVRTERYKYMFRLPDRQYRLYDLESDPQEQRNLLSATEVDGALVKELNGFLRAWYDDADPPESRLVGSKEQLRALKALGYMGDQQDIGD